MSKIELEEIRLTGYVISSGIAIGKPFFLKTFQKIFQDEGISASRVNAEIKRFNEAVSSVATDLLAIREQLIKDNVYEGVSILDTQLQVLSDPLLIDEVQQQVQSKLKPPEYILQQLIEGYQKKFEALEDPFFRERFKDIQDIARRILSHLFKESNNSLSELTSEFILFAKDLSPTETAEAGHKNVKAIISERGSLTAHASILARAKEIPYMTNISISLVSDYPESVIIVDGKKGELIINPKYETLENYKKLSTELSERRQYLARKDGEVVATRDGNKIKLMANIETCEEIAKIHEFGGEGVGLYRSENILVGCASIPSEDEQFEIYQKLVREIQGLPITIRTFDVGRDKAGIDIKYGKTDNSFLGFRAIGNREHEREIFMVQLRAILRASIFGKVNILFPMVSSLTELLLAKQMLNEAAEQVNVPLKVGVGCMIEVPSAAIIVDLLARECDFLSIGTNDLIHFILAADRCDHTLKHLYQPTHPSVLRLIRQTVNEAHRCNIPVCICGEIAANPRFTPLLLGLGINEFSVAARYIPLLKNAIRFSNMKACYELTEKALNLADASAIQELLNEAFEKHFARDLLEDLM